MIIRFFRAIVHDGQEQAFKNLFVGTMHVLSQEDVERIASEHDLILRTPNEHEHR